MPPEQRFWDNIPAYANLSAEAFLDPTWQLRHSIRSPQALLELIANQVDSAFQYEVSAALQNNPMALRLTPYVVSLINWNNPWHDPIRRQFIPISREYEPDHPSASRDILNEQGDSPLDGIVRRYKNRVLFLTATTCPVYCRFCTRSYLVGPPTATMPKSPPNRGRTAWTAALEWIKEHREINDVILSGGDCYNLSSEQLKFICDGLIAIPHISTIRLATKGLCVLPSRIIELSEWTQTFIGLAERARNAFKALVIHTHFNHPSEITWVTTRAAKVLFRAGITVRNQTVLLRGINDEAAVLSGLITALSSIQIHPYYIFIPDIVKDSEWFRLPLSAALSLQRELIGLTSGFNTPRFVIDLPGGGGKRPIDAFVSYDPISGISVYSSMPGAPERQYRYYDPVR